MELMRNEMIRSEREQDRENQNEWSRAIHEWTIKSYSVLNYGLSSLFNLQVDKKYKIKKSIGHTLDHFGKKETKLERAIRYEENAYDLFMALGAKEVKEDGTE